MELSDTVCISQVKRRGRSYSTVQRQMRVRPWKSSDTGTTCFILPQLRQEDPEPWLTYMRMSPEMFTCYLVLCHISSFIIVIYGTTLSRVVPVLFPWCSRVSHIAPVFPRSSRVFPVRDSTIEGVVVFARSPRFYPYLPVSPHFFPCHSRSLPGLSVFSRIANISRNGPIRGVCIGGIR